MLLSRVLYEFIVITNLAASALTLGLLYEAHYISSILTSFPFRKAHFFTYFPHGNLMPRASRRYPAPARTVIVTVSQNAMFSIQSHMGGGVSGDQLEFLERSLDGGKKLLISHCSYDGEELFNMTPEV